MIKTGKSYSAKNTDLQVYINKVTYKSENYTKVKLTLVNKKNGIIYETGKKYKLIHDQIKHWEEV